MVIIIVLKDGIHKLGLTTVISFDNSLGECYNLDKLECYLWSYTLITASKLETLFSEC